MSIDADLTTYFSSAAPADAFRDKVVWITGASSGIGECLAVEMAKRGAKLVLSARRENELKRVKELTKLSDDRCKIVVLDLEDLANLPAKAKAAVDAFGFVDVLVNNGGASTRSLALYTPFTLDQKIMNIDYFGQLLCTKAVLPSMTSRKTGVIVNVVSIAGKIGGPLRSAYSAAKFALLGYADCLRMELIDYNIAVVNILPGSVKTKVSDNAILADGTTLGLTDDGILNGMELQRCIDLMIKAIYNKIDESWICLSPQLIATYMSQYAPVYSRAAGRKIANKMVDGLGKKAAERVRATSKL